jgi:hypothetical protein
MKCDRCQRELTPSEPVWKYFGQFGRLDKLGSICDECFSKTWSYRPEEFREQDKRWAIERYRDPEPCAQCGRPVRIKRSYKRRQVICGPECRQAVYNERARRSRNPQPCRECGKVFQPRRTDSLFCSVACKQKAYRRRGKVIPIAV